MINRIKFLLIIILFSSKFIDIKSDMLIENANIKECINNVCKIYSLLNTTVNYKEAYDSNWINQTLDYGINQILIKFLGHTISENTLNVSLSNQTDSIIKIGETEYAFPPINQYFEKSIPADTYPDYESLKLYLTGFVNKIISDNETPIMVHECPQGSQCIEINKCTEVRVKLYQGIYTKKDVDRMICDTKPNRICCTPDQIQYLLPSWKQCGYKDDSTMGSNGIVATPFEYPWMALVTNQTNLKPENTFKAFCGGFLISNQYVLTSAHCVDDNRDSYVVRLAEHDITQKRNCIEDTDLCSDKIDINVEKVIIHPNYSLWESINDIALLRLSIAVNFSVFVMPICLPYDITYEDNKLNPIEVAGWGATENSFSSNVLLKLYFKTSVFTECNKYYENLLLEKYTICAVGYNENTDTCRGDSGGPLMAYHNGRMVAFGIVKMGRRNVACGKNMDKPGVYERISTHIEFILDNMY